MALTDRNERGPSPAAQFLLLIDRARHDRAFRAELRREPIAAAARLGLTFSDAEWHGLRGLLID